MDKAFSDIAATGATTVRYVSANFLRISQLSFFQNLVKISDMYLPPTIDDIPRGFHEVTSPDGIYYQSWSGSTPTISTGSTGLQNFGEF